MPELPEIETLKRGLAPFLNHQEITGVCVRHTQLRRPVQELTHYCTGQFILSVFRRAKYLILELSHGHLLIHLGMSGTLRIVNADYPLQKHDHIDLYLQNGKLLRYNDPRRFGLWLYINEALPDHFLLRHLGPEPLSDDFNADYLSRRAHGRKQSIKSFIMANETVVGVGNIYATESLFFAGIHPKKSAGALKRADYSRLVEHIKEVLKRAIKWEERHFEISMTKKANPAISSSSYKYMDEKI